MHELRIAKDRCSVVLSLVGGETISGAMFVQHADEVATRRESARDVLNSAEPFFPIETPSGDTLLIAKDRVVEVCAELPEDTDELRRASARTALLDIVLSGGVVRSGQVLLEMPSDQPRLLDFFNRLSERFLVLYADDGTRLVNRALIERVLPRD
ncbi:MAG TPA: hypothetical protein VFU01_12175 [Gemmatimonadaceae bacterium]|nr:hypothetical protein [Gemmatimonadaceae bacterium]